MAANKPVTNAAFSNRDKYFCSTDTSSEMLHMILTVARHTPSHDGIQDKHFCSSNAAHDPDCGKTHTLHDCMTQHCWQDFSILNAVVIAVHAHGLTCWQSRALHMPSMQA